jgi:hypothetical protein
VGASRGHLAAFAEKFEIERISEYVREKR